MRQVPGEAAAEFQAVEHEVARFQEVGAGLPVALEDGAEEAPAPLVGRQPGADHEHAGRVDDGVEELAFPQAGALAEGAVEALGDVLDCHLVGERAVGADVDVLLGVAVAEEHVPPRQEGGAAVRVAVDEYDGVPLGHGAPLPLLRPGTLPGDGRRAL